MADTTTTTLTELGGLFIEEATFAMSQGNSLMNYVKKRNKPQGVSTVRFARIDNVSAASLTEGTAPTAVALDSGNSANVSCAEYGLTIRLTDPAVSESDIADLMTTAGRVAGEAVGDIINQTIYGLFDGFSSAVGTTNVDISEANILAAVRTLMENKAPRPYYMSITPHTFEDLLTLYSTNTNITAESVRNQVLTEGTAPAIYGVIPVIVDNLATGTGAGQAEEADTKAGVWSPEALGAAIGYELRAEESREGTNRATDLTVTSYVGFGEIVDSYGVEFLMDNKD